METLRFSNLYVRGLLALIILTLGVGCGSKTSAPGTDDSSEAVNQPNDPTDDGTDDDTDDDGTPDPADVSQFTGIWGRYDCTYSSALGADATGFVNIGEKYIVQTVRTYLTKGQLYRCAKPAVKLRYIYKYNATASNLDTNIFNLNSNLKRVEMTAATAAIATQLNKIKYFGRTNWKVKVKQTFLPPFNAQKFPQVRFDILGVQGGYIYFGDTSNPAHNGSTPAKRPVEIDFSSALYRLYST
jgi:hypothetical protein